MLGVATVHEMKSKGMNTSIEIIASAHSLFLEYGYHGTSMRQIASQSGIALGRIYNHFDCKEDIFASVLDNHHPSHEILPILQNAQGESVEDFVSDAADSMISALERRPDFLNLMFIEIVEFDQKHLPDMFEHFFPEIIILVENFTQREGNLRPIPTPIIIRAFIGMIFALYLSENILRNYMPLELKVEVRDYMIDMFLHGIIAR